MAAATMSSHEVTFDDVWAQFDEARNCAVPDKPGNAYEDEDDEQEDEWGQTAAQRAHQDMRSRVVVLPDGDIHVCDECCPYAEQGCDGTGRPNGDWVCCYTGRVVMRVCEERTDLSTGRSTWSVDPDMQGGGPGKWRKKRDMKKDSEQAYVASKDFDDTAMPQAAEVKAVRVGTKRGALRVDEAEPEDVGPKRNRTSKKDVHSTTTRSLLLDEAATTFARLFGKHTAAPMTTSKKPLVDARLLDFNLLFQAAVRKYLKEIAAKGGRPSLDDIHNVALAVDNVIADEKRKHGAEEPAARSNAVTGIHFRNRAARLAVALWSAACSISYLSQARRGADSFRPFCAGVFYAMKRGLALADGTILVPKIDAFTEALPSNKAIASDASLKSLHASSHRGLCTLHRCIGSAGKAEEAKRIFAESIQISRSLI